MSFWKSFLHYPLVCAGIGWFTARILKVFTEVFRLRRFSVAAMFLGNGGVPSSRSADAAAWAVSGGLRGGCALGPAIPSLVALIPLYAAHDAFLS